MAIGRGLRLGIISTVLALLAVVLSGGLFRVFSSRIVQVLAAFTAWLCICTPFSVWRGGSAQQLVGWALSLVSLILLAGCVDHLEQCRRALYAMAVSVLTMELLSFALGTTQSRRDTGRLSFVSGTLANANDLAALLLIGLPFCLLVVRTRTGFSVLRMAGFLGLLLIPVTVFRTGSRAGLLALAVLFTLYFVSLPALRKIPVAIAVLLVAVGAVFVSHGTVLERYKAMFVDDDQAYYASEAEASAVESARSRKQLFRNSLRLTVEHPVFGVGPGMFAVADAADAQEAKRQAAWHQTHNTFTQVSSEAGIPALILYVAAIVFCFKALHAVSRSARVHPELGPAGEMAFCLRLSLLAFTITAFFSSNAYAFHFPLVAGLCAALEQSVASQTKALQALPEAGRETLPPPPARPAPGPARGFRLGAPLRRG
jgi:O-antigen ligase